MKTNLIHKFADRCLKQTIFENASERQENIFKIKELSFPLNEHLFKIYSMPKSKFLEYWSDEIDNFLI